MMKLKIKPFLPSFNCQRIFFTAVLAAGILLYPTCFIVWAQSGSNSKVPIQSEDQRIDIDEEEPQPDVTPLTRAQFISKLMQLLEQDKNRVSQFPTFRDVPLSSPDYADIEIARERRMLPQTEDFTPQGFFKPNQFITRREALEIFERTLSGKQPSLETSELILQPYVDVALIDDALKPILAKLIYVRLIRSERLQPMENIDQLLRAPFTEDDWQKISSRLLAIRKKPYLLLPKADTDLQALEAGIVLKVLPAKAIFKERLGVGDDVYFTVSEEHEFLPKGSSIHGKVLEKTDDSHYMVVFNQAKTPNDVYYKTRATLNLTFEGRDKDFIIPTEPMIITTETVLPPVINTEG